MQAMTLRGTPAQMGTQHGEILGKVGIDVPTLGPDFQQLGRACEAIAKEYTPAFVAEMEAFAAAANIPADVLKTFTLTIPLQQTIPSCSVVAVLPERSANGKLMVGRNYDFDYEIAWEGATRYHTYPAEGYAHIGNCDIWIGREDGVNAAGLFAAMSATFIEGVQPGLPFWFIVRHLLEHCATVDEALVWIQAVPHSQSRNYMLADGQRAVVVEASIDGCRIREAQDGVLVMTNHPMHPDFQPRTAFVPEDSPMRYTRLQALSDAKVSIEDLKRALNDREQRVCAHFLHNNRGYGTIWSVIAQPADKQLAIAPGTGDNESQMVYRSFSL